MEQLERLVHQLVCGDVDTIVIARVKGEYAVLIDRDQGRGATIERAMTDASKARCGRLAPIEQHDQN